MFWTEEKLALRIGELNGYRYRDAVNISSFRFQADQAGEVGARAPAPDAVADAVLRIGDRWKGRDLYIWLTAEAEIPASWSGRRTLGRFDFGKTGGGTNSGFESLLYVDGRPYQGVDSNHREVFFPASAAGSKLLLQFRLWSGLEGGGRPKIQEHTLKLAELCWLDEDADDLYFTGKAIIETVRELEPSRPERDLLLRALDRAFLLVDWSRPGSQQFYASVRKARQTLRGELSRIDKHHPVTVTCIGHTHIDVAWLWRLKHTREKAARSFSTVLRLMELYPDYIFLQSQPQLYDYIKNDYPDIYEQIRARVKEGRWEADGAMWLEADCNVTSGESLVRQILYGTRFLRREFGVECKYLWLPDVFGYSWALPQILVKSGIRTFMTTKISWSEYNRFPHDTFRWRGIDGTEVLTHFITTPDPGADLGYYTYNGKMTAREVKGIWEAYRDKSMNQELLLSYGYGDGGGGVNREMLEMRRRLNELPGLPKVRTGRADAFFERLHATVDATDQYVHTWNGELYLEYHRGTYTTQAYNKRMNRKLELLYREAEWLGVAASLWSGWTAYDHERLNEGWKIILRNQFHDIIPGSSIREVYEDSKAEYETAESLGRSVRAQALAAAVKPARDTFTVINSASWPVSDLALLPVDSGIAGRWTDERGRLLAAQKTADGWLVRVTDVPPFAARNVKFVAGEPEKPAAVPFHFHRSGIVTPHYEIEWNEAGQLTRLYDSANDRDVLVDGERGNVLQVFEDKPRRHDAWDIDIFYREKMKEATDLRELSLLETGPLRAVVRFVWKFMDSTIAQRMIVYADSRRIDFETEVDWQERQQFLKVAFPVQIHATEATYDIQFGNVRRPTHWNTSWDYARFETVGHWWADLSERSYGVSLLNDCKYGYDIKDRVLRLSLLRSPVHPDTEADRGHHRFTYALLPHAGDWMEGGTVREAWSLNQPLAAVSGAHCRSGRSLFKLSSDRVMIDAVKKAEDSDAIVLRLHEYAGATGNVEIASDFDIVSWQECDLMERPAGERQHAGTIRVRFAPYEIKSFLIEVRDGGATKS